MGFNRPYINPLKQPPQLFVSQLYDVRVLATRPGETIGLQALVPEGKTGLVPVQNLKPLAASAAEDE